MEDARVALAARGPMLQPQTYLQSALPYWLPPPTPPPSALRDNKGKNVELWPAVDAQAAFLGPSLWDAQKDQQLKYTDLEEFLNENEEYSPPRPSQPQSALSPAAAPHQQPQTPRPVPPPPLPPDHQQLRRQGRAWQQQQQQQQLPACDMNGRNEPDQDEREQLTNGEVAGGGVKVKVEFQVSPSDLALATVPGTQFDPQTHQFSDDDLKPQAICKKSKKQVVPEERKDQRYWTRRQRNNTAAKRSRDARRLKENQIALRANFLEKENAALREVMDELTRKNQELRARVNTCQCR